MTAPLLFTKLQLWNVLLFVWFSGSKASRPPNRWWRACLRSLTWTGPPPFQRTNTSFGSLAWAGLSLRVWMSTRHSCMISTHEIRSPFGDPMGKSLDYASKEWGGLVEDYYLQRWACFVNTLVELSGQRKTIQNKTSFNQAVFPGWEGVRLQPRKYPSKPLGDTHEIARRIFPQITYPYAPERLKWRETCLIHLP